MDLNKKGYETIEIQKHMKEKEKTHELLKDVLEEKYVENGNEDFEFDELIFKKKRVPNWNIDEKIKEELENVGVLPFCSTVKKKQEKQYHIQDFRIDQGKKLHLYKKPLKGEEKEIAEAKQEQQEEQFKNKWREEQFEELVTFFKSNKRQMDMMKDNYEIKRTELLDLMIKKKKQKLSLDNDCSFSVIDNQPEYDIVSLFEEDKIEKNLLFVYKIEDDEVICQDLYTNDIFSFPLKDETGYAPFSYLHDGHDLTIIGERLAIDNILLAEIPIKELKGVKKPYKEKLQEEEWKIVSGKTFVSGPSFFQSMPVSSTKIQAFIEKGILEPKLLNNYRYLEHEDDISVHFEVIGKEADEKRRSFFFEKLIRTGLKYKEKMDIQREYEKAELK